MEHLLLTLDQVTVGLALRKLLIEHVDLVLLLLGLRAVDLPQDLLFLEVFDLLLFLDDLFTEFLGDLTVLDFGVGEICLSFSAKLLPQLLDTPLMLCPELVHLPALRDQLTS